MKNILKYIFSITRKDEFKTINILGCKYKYKSLTNKVLFNKMEDLQKTLERIDYKQNLIMDYFMETRNAKQASGNLRKFQEESVGLLKEFIRICDKYNLRYWLDFGSLLGAVRHSGFIPWDDDLDVSMPESDFIKLREIANKEIIPEMEYIVYDEIEMVNRLVYKKDKLKCFLDIYSYEEIGNMLKIKLNSPNKYSKEPVPIDMMFPASYLNFENVSVKCPKDWDKYLRIRFGNYELMPKVPPIITGHVNVDEHI